MGEVKQTFIDWLKANRPGTVYEEKKLEPLTLEEVERTLYASKVVRLEVRGQAPVTVSVEAMLHERDQFGIRLKSDENGRFYQLSGKTYGKTWRLWLQCPNGGQWRAVPRE